MVDIFVANGIELSIKKCCDGVVHVTCVLWGGVCFIVGCYMKGVVAYCEVGEWGKVRLYRL